MTFLPECGADKSCISSLSNFPTHHNGFIMIPCKIWWNKKYKDLEQVYINQKAIMKIWRTYLEVQLVHPWIVTVFIFYNREVGL